MPLTRKRQARRRRTTGQGSTTATLRRGRTIRLARGSWMLEATPLGTGGFGAVYPAKGEDGRDVAVKELDSLGRLPVERELEMAERLIGRTCEHVIPIFDVGRDAGGAAFIVMARASESLASVLKRRRTLTEVETVDVLQQTLAGLEEIADIIHRDLKPANVLLHDGLWKIADFGLVRAADAATSSQTVKLAFTPHYAAPEQWRGERATHATDVYALGCIGYAALTSAPPFPGPGVEDLRAQHASQVPRELAVSATLRGLLQQCLQKAPSSRPTLASCRAELERAANPAPAKPLPALQEVAAVLAAAKAKEDAAQAVRVSHSQEREHLAQAGIQAVRDLFKEFFERLRAAAPIASANLDGSGIRLGRASLSYKVAFRTLQADSFPRSNFPAIAGVYMELRQLNSSYPGRSANLWLAKIESEDYGWWEASYMTMTPSRRTDQPFGIDTSSSLEIADRAAGPAMDVHQYAMKLTRVDGDGREPFIERWAARFAAAAVGTLDYPRYLPE